MAGAAFKTEHSTRPRATYATSSRSSTVAFKRTYTIYTEPKRMGRGIWAYISLPRIHILLVMEHNPGMVSPNLMTIPGTAAPI